ncbi:hypothetical protein [Rothia halotolerans]|uniref:hypothetical protein n=1 Tax=Rothia halotolerans TaxID=405770 RepID=UPI00101C8ED3|nr:hypothetical protein [Rothia halotolerans]
MRIIFIRLFYGLIALLSAVAVFAQLHETDSEMTLGSRHLLWITDVHTGFSPEKFHERLGEELEARDINAARLDFDADDPVRSQVLQLRIGNPDLSSARWAEEGYPVFDKGQHVTVETLDRPLEDPRGIYMLYGPEKSKEGLLESLAETGYGGAQRTLYANQDMVDYLRGSPFAWAFSASVLGIAFAVMASAVMGSRVYAQRFLFGSSPLGAYVREARAALLTVLVSFIGVQAMAAVVLLLYNGMAFYGLFWKISLLVTVVITVLILVVHLVAVQLVSRVDIPEAIKGRQPVRSSYAAVSLVKIGCLVGLLSLMQISFSTAGLMADHRSSSALLSTLGQVSYVDQRGVTPEEADRRSTAEWFAGEIGRGNVIIAQNKPLMKFGPDFKPLSLTSALAVDQNYLRLHAEQVPEAARWIAEDEHRHQPAVFLPEGREVSREELEEVVPYGFPEQRLADFTEHRIPAGRDVFTYGSSINEDPLSVHDPLVVYLPQEDLLASADSVAAWATQGGAIIEDRAGAMDRLAESPARTLVASIKPVAVHQASYLKKYGADLRTSLYGAVAFGVVLVLALLAYAVLYCRENGQEIFVKHLSGWGFLGTFRALLGVEVLVMAGVVAWQAYRTVGESQGLLSTGADDGVVTDFLRFSWGSIGALVLLDLALLLGALLLSSRRDITERTRTE